MTWVTQASPMGGTSSGAYQVLSNGSVAVIYGSNAISAPGSITLQWSSDRGVTWNAASVNPIDDPYSVVRGALCWSDDLGLWLVNGWDGAGWMICTSPDGDVWTRVFSDYDAPGENLYYGTSAWLPGPGLFVVMTWGAADGRCLTSPDGVTWTVHNTNGMDRSSSIAWSVPEGIAVLVGQKGSAGTLGPVATSTDGINWTDQTTPWSGSYDYPQKVIWSDTWSAFFISGDDFVARSPDGIVWTDISPNGYIYTIGELADGRLMLADVPFAPLSSDGGNTWANQPTAPFSYSMEDISSDANQNYLVGKVKYGTEDVVVTGTPVNVTPPSGLPGASPLWKYFVASLDGTGISDYSKLASARVCEVVLNAPLSLRGTVPSDSPQANLVYTADGYDDPYLNEGTRLLWGFRRESDTAPYYTVRAGTLINLVGDTAQQDDATSAFTGWDPWHYLFSRPVCNVDGSLPGKDGLSFSNTQAAVIVATLLQNTIDNHGFAYIDAGTMFSGSYQFTGNLETSAAMAIDIVFQQGTSVGQAWQQICDTGVCDIVLEPVYAPAGRILTDLSTVYNFLVQLNVYAQAGSTHDELIFAWNLPGRSLTGLTRIFDGSSRANNLAFQAGQGGVFGAAPVQTDAASETKFGEYWGQQFFPGVTGAYGVPVVTSLAEQQLALRKDGRETVTFAPAPERSPRPWQDYNLGDRVPVWASRAAFRDVLGEEASVTQYQRIYGWTANISDDALETIDPVLTSPQGFTG